jgi:hypothetical protein
VSKNYFLCLTEEAAKKVIARFSKEEEEARFKAEVEKAIATPRVVVSTEDSIRDENVVNNRDLVRRFFCYVTDY